MKLYLCGLNKTKYIVINTLIRTLVSLGFGYFLMTEMGIGGFGLAIFIGEVLCISITYMYFYKNVRIMDIRKIVFNIKNLSIFLLCSFFILTAYINRIDYLYFFK